MKKQDHEIKGRKLDVADRSVHVPSFRISGVIFNKKACVYLGIEIKDFETWALEPYLSFYKDEDSLEIKCPFDTCFEHSWIPQGRYSLYAETVNNNSLNEIYSRIFAKLLVELIFVLKKDTSTNKDIYEVEARLDGGKSLFTTIDAGKLKYFLEI